MAKMKEPPAKNIIYFFALLLPLFTFTNAAPSPEPTRLRSNSASGHNSGFISNPSIYSYTVANNQNPLERSQQQQQQQQVKATLNNDVNNNYVNFATNSNYRSASGGISSRNFYFTNNLNSKDISLSPTTAATAQPTQPVPTNGCTLDRLAVYKIVLHTYWTRDSFPKHYPDWRPTAQWTKTLGRTHDGSYALYHIGKQATSGVKQFAETGKSDILDSVAGEQQQQQIAGNSFTSFVSTTAAGVGATSGSQPQQQSSMHGGERSVFDEFNIPAILNGAGRSEAKFFVDSNHSFVSLMTRIVPSPDWFIGVDSFQLCVGGSWIDTVTVEMDPLDAGTDNGFTFTAPNWPTSPQGVIYRITSRYPAHPAGSFFYPKSKRLPPIATFQFIKLKEYELSEVFNFAEDERKYETVKTQTHLETEHNHMEMNNELSASIERERQNEISPKPTSISERDKIRSQLLAKMNPIYNNNTNSYTNIVPKNDKNALMQNIANSYRSRSEISATSSSSSASSRATSLAKRRRIKSKHTRDCRVSHWSEWSACSKMCGIGEMHRYRKVIKHGKRGGRPCPPLQESKWCGSEKGCHSPATYFNWSNT